MRTKEVEDKLRHMIKHKEQEMGLNPEGAKNLFVSYHTMTKDLKESGFGNMVTKFYPELYKNDMARFIMDLEKSIEMALKTLHNKEVMVKILFFR